MFATVLTARSSRHDHHTPENASNFDSGESGTARYALPANMDEAFWSVYNVLNTI